MLEDKPVEAIPFLAAEIAFHDTWKCYLLDNLMKRSPEALKKLHAYAQTLPDDLDPDDRFNKLENFQEE